MKNRNISKEIQTKVKRYLEYNYREEKKEGDLKFFLNSLPKKFQNDVISDMYLKNFLENKLFQNFSNEFLKKLSLKVKEVSYAPEDIIIQV